MATLGSDLKYAVREMARRPAFTATAVLSLALGIGATSAVFSVIYAVLIDPFPYRSSEKMVQLALRDKAGKYRYPGFNGAQMDLLRQAKSIESIVGNGLPANRSSTYGSSSKIVNPCSSESASSASRFWSESVHPAGF